MSSLTRRLTSARTFGTRIISPRAILSPPPKTVVDYDLPRLPPAPVEPRVTPVVPEPTHEILESSAVKPKKGSRSPRHRQLDANRLSNWDYSSSRSYGFRPGSD